MSKRCLDVVASALALLALSPLLLGIYLLQCITTKGSAFFQQERIGLGGKPFHILKFRTMKEDAEENGPRLTNKQDASKFTPLGQFLRKHHLDELPQLWNVLIGDMSIVGYRPERQYFIDIILQHDNRYALLYQMRPGITSEAAITNGYTDTIEKMLLRLDLDLKYMESASLTKDFHIIVRTFLALF